MSSTGSIDSAFVKWHDPSFNIRGEQELSTKSAIDLPSPPIRYPGQTSALTSPLDPDYLFNGDRAKLNCMMRFIREDLSETYRRGTRSNREVPTITNAAGKCWSNESDRSSTGRENNSDGARDAEVDDSDTTASSKGADSAEDRGRGNGRTLRRRPAFGK